MSKRKLWHLADPDTENKGWHQVDLHATDAMHALEVDGDHWKVEKPTEEVVEEFLGKSEDAGGDVE